MKLARQLRVLDWPDVDDCNVIAIDIRHLTSDFRIKMNFMLQCRLYEPEKSVVEGEFKLPEMERVE